MRFVFKEFIVDTSLFTMTKNGLKVEVEPRVFELLRYFCQHPNVPISRDELIEHVWQQRTVGYAAINRAVSELRKILETEPAKPEIITTISKIGYQFTLSPEIQTQPVKQQEIKAIQIESLTPKYPQEPTNSHNIEDVLQKPRKLTHWLLYVSVVFLLITMTIYFAKFWQKDKKTTNFAERPLTALKGTAFRAVQSGDGKDLLFIHKDKANNYAKVWIQHKNQSPIKLTTDESYYTFAIFGDNNQIIASRFNNLHERKCEIVSIDKLTYTVSPLFGCADRALTPLAYSPKRKTLYFNYRTEVNSPFSIYAYQLATSRLQQITFAYSDGNIRGDYFMSLSPTEDRLAVFEYQNNSASILKIIDLSSNKLEYHQHEFDTNATLTWLNHNQLVISDSEGLQRYHLNDRSLQRLLANSNIGFASANASTGIIAFDKGAITANIYQYAIDDKVTSKNKTAITNSSFVNYRPQFANTSYKTAYTSTDEGKTSIVLKAESGAAFKTNFTQVIKNLASIHWSPDDNYLAASINSQLQLFNIKTKQWQTLLPQQKNIHYVHFANNENIIFSSDISGDWQIWRLHISSGQLKQLTENGGYSAQGDPDSGFIYFTKFNHTGMYKLNLISGGEEKVINDFKITSWNKWKLRDETIYYSDDKGIKTFNTKSQTTNLILEHSERPPASFSVSFDQKYLQREIIEESSANIWAVETKQH